MKEFINKTIIAFTLLILFMIPLNRASAKSRKDDSIHASVKVVVDYGAVRNRESYREDILNAIENYLVGSGCFEKVVIGNQEEPELILEAIIEKLTMEREYGAPLGDIASDHGDPGLKEKLIIRYQVRIQVAVKRSSTEEVLFVSRIDVDESRSRMYPSEDTEKFAWETVLSAVEREAEKHICGKKEKIAKALSSQTSMTSPDGVR